MSLQQQSALIARELEVNRGTFEKGLTRLDRLLALERAARNLEGQAGTNAASIARTRGRIAELELQILQVDARRIEEAEQQARDAKAQENQVRERLALVRERLERMEVRAPAPGIVFGMRVAAPGEVVQPGEPILQVVPEDSDFVVMAQIEPIHVDQVYPGQEAVLRFTAFPLQVIPEFEGHVARVSADAVLDPASGRSWYEVELAMGGPLESVTSAPGAERSFADSLAGALGLGGSRHASGGLAGELALTPGDAGRGSHANPGALGNQLSRQAGDGLLPALDARGMTARHKRGTGAGVNDEAVEIALANDLRELARVAARIDEFCAARGLGPQVGYAVNLAVDEVLTNSITSGYDDDELHRIEVIVCKEADTIVVVIVDDSTAFDVSQARCVRYWIERRGPGPDGAWPVSRAPDDGRRRVPAGRGLQRRDAYERTPPRNRRVTRRAKPEPPTSPGVAAGAQSSRLQPLSNSSSLGYSSGSRRSGINPARVRVRRRTVTSPADRFLGSHGHIIGHVGKSSSRCVTRGACDPSLRERCPHGQDRLSREPENSAKTRD